MHLPFQNSCAYKQMLVTKYVTIIFKYNYFKVIWNKISKS